MSWRCVVWLPALVAAGCRLYDVNGDGVITVSCTGDSMTDQRFIPSIDTWCTQLAAAHPAWRVINRGIAGAHAVGDDTKDIFAAYGQVTAALANDRPDLVALAFGTNDCLGRAQPPAAIVNALIERVNQIEATGALALVIAVPLYYSGTGTQQTCIANTNAYLANLLREQFVDDTPELIVDDFLPQPNAHLNQAGQDVRGAAVMEWMNDG